MIGPQRSCAAGLEVSNAKEQAFVPPPDLARLHLSQVGFVHCLSISFLISWLCCWRSSISCNK